MPGGYLRCSWRRTDRILPLDAIGRGIPKGSGLLGSGGYPLLHGGLVFNKVSAVGSNTVASQAYYSLGADTIMASVFGINQFGQGWKILPYAIWPRVLSGTAGGDTSIFNLWYTLTTSDDSTIKWYAQIQSATADNKASYFSCVWYWAGFIISGP